MDAKSNTLAVSQNELTVSWEMAVPPLKPRMTHIWDQSLEKDGVIDGQILPGDRDITAALDWSPRTLAVLRLAFAQRLDRYQGWSGESLSSSYLRPLAEAAAVYKRGVAYRPDAFREPSHKMVKGSYRIQKKDAQERVSLDQGFILVDKNLWDLWKDREDCPIQWDSNQAVMMLWDSQETTKNLDSVGMILKQWRHWKEKRPSLTQWYVVGGGILGDLGGFCAGLVGQPVTFVPTTLLAMVDACVGGKTGVNFEPYGKNQVGLFYFPQDVWIWPLWLETLPERQWRSGAVECFKHGLLQNDPQKVTRIAEMGAQRDLSTLDSQLLRLIEIKASLVAQDPAETGARALLNLGHTLGHALETLSQLGAQSSQDHLLHGEAVGLGLIFALLLSQKKGGMPPDEAELGLVGLQGLLDWGRSMSVERLGSLLQGVFLEDPGLWVRLKMLMGADKKNVGTAIRWVLLEGLGRPYQPVPDVWTTPVEERMLEETWQDFVEFLKAF